MKIFKKLATLALALTLCAGIGAFAACDNTSGSSNSSSSSSNVETGAYLFKVLKADGSAATGYLFGLCSLKDDGSKNLCYGTVTVDETGMVSYSADNVMGFPGEGKYAPQITDADFNEIAYEMSSPVPTSYNTEPIVITLK